MKQAGEAAIREEILRLEKARCEALVSGDYDTLESLMADDLVHVHGNGHIDGKAAYLEAVRSKFKFHRVDRGELNIRIYGDVAVVVGPLSQSVSVKGSDEAKAINALTNQTWVRGATGWKQSTCQNQFLSVGAVS